MKKITEAQFQDRLPERFLTYTPRGKESRTVKALRLHLVEGYSKAEAARIQGISGACIGGALKRIKLLGFKRALMLDR
tara:strand:- start:1350 stop:1583 length:234 start_codon:yes stop_codon:yes gene_type:complete